MREQYMRCGEGFIICYSITDRHSFNEAVEYRNLITKVRATEEVPVILVANKVDLEQTRRLVETSEGQALATKFGCSFYETSAAHRRHVDDVFHTLVREIRKRDEEGEFKENETSKWRKVWNNIFRKIKRGRRKI
eukprot:GFUD01139304.1.p1 GENE.GFUD01139304.1~~GFUD01139304.1.p1  ORF type:complete len:135 (-),score=37.04 GFUD01139304.1:225-629(-)